MSRLLLLLLLVIGSTGVFAAEDVRVWQTVRGKRIEGSFARNDGDKIVIQKKNSKETVSIPREELMPPDTIYLEQLEKKGKSAPATPTPAKPGIPAPKPAPGAAPAVPLPGDMADDEEVPGEPAKGRLYPRTKEEIRSALREIEQRDKPKDLNKEVHDAICRLNAYRYLSGVMSNVGTEPRMVEGSYDASKACAAAGTISHSLGHSTDKCNLSAGHHDIASTVDGYIGDGGDNNRERRGHRRWCLNPPMQNAGFGREGIYSAMWCMDSGGQKPRDPWAYPGRGLYPREYVKGNAWSFYMTGALPDDTKVRIWKLLSRPEQSIPWGEEPKGREIEVGYSFVYDNTINFEPDPKILGKRGIYWVRVHGRGVREQYLTELF